MCNTKRLSACLKSRILPIILKEYSKPLANPLKTWFVLEFRVVSKMSRPFNDFSRKTIRVITQIPGRRDKTPRLKLVSDLYERP